MSILVEPKLKKLHELVQDATKEELIWINGYLAGIISGSGSPALPTPSTAPKKITLLYGTETGNAKRLANQFSAEGKKHGVITKLHGMDQYKPQDIEKEDFLFIIISTQGEGEPPAAAKKFCDYINVQPLTLQKLQYSVLALGDSSYPLFCQAGIDVDQCLERLGAKRVIPLQMCDVDYAGAANNWYRQVLHYVDSFESPSTAINKINGNSKSGKKYYQGTVSASINLNDRGSHKRTQHIELSCADAPDYAPGDSLGLIPHNPPELVDAIIHRLVLAEDLILEHKVAKATLRTLLTERLNVLNLSNRVIQNVASVLQQSINLTQHTLEELLEKYPLQGVQAQSVILALEPITPRLYSISSSPSAHEGEIHLTVGWHTFLLDEKSRTGHGSGYLCSLNEGDQVTFYIHHNHDFKLPAPEKDVIMIGPGTGIAPFRSFLAEREMTGATGRNWLFFGDQHFTTDFLYQTELQAWFLSGHLSRLNVAFSRDQQDKIYVQHKLLQYASQLYEWIEAGACIYVCGAREPMSQDVENTLIEIIGRHRHIEVAQALGFLEDLKNQGRYNLDVY